MSAPMPTPVLPKLPRRDSFGAKFGRFVMLGLGVTLVISSVVNIVGAYQLIEASDEQSLGISRNQIVGTYAVMAVGGVALIWAGLRKKK
jgi:hypothetical protein